MRIPLKWGTKYSDVGQRRSETTLVTAMISKVPDFSQDVCSWRGQAASFRFHHFVLLGRIPLEAGHDYVGSGARVQAGAKVNPTARRVPAQERLHFPNRVQSVYSAISGRDETDNPVGVTDDLNYATIEPPDG